MRRRRFLGLALAGIAAVPWLVARAVRAAPGAAAGAKSPAGAPAPRRGGSQAAAPSAACRDGLAVAKQQILTYCATLAFPNGAMHAVRAFGREAPLGPGDPFRLLLESYCVESYFGERVFLEVGAEKEGHHSAMLKTLIEKGCEPDLEFALHGRPYRFQDYVDSTRLLTVYPGNIDIDEHSWTIMAMALVLPPAQARWTNAHGQTVDLERMIDDTSAALWSDTELIRRVDLGRADPPRDCKALARACGGMHMLYALAVALGAGYRTPARMQAFAGHMRTLMRRIVYDNKVIDAVERQNVELAGAEAARAVAYDARIKFLGHMIETVGVVDRHKLYAFAPDERRLVDEARERLCRELFAGRDLKFERYRGDSYLYDSMTTNICHAYNGLLSSPA